METLSRNLLTFLLNSLWQIPLITAVAALACRFMRSAPARYRHVVWVAAVIAAALLPAAGMRAGGHISGSPFIAPGAPQPAAASHAAAPVAVAAGSLPAASHRTVAYAPATASALLALYLLFVGARMVHLLRAWSRTRQIRGGSWLSEQSAIVRHVWQRSLDAFRQKGVELLASRHISSPVAAGGWRKTIILPEPLFSSTDENVLSAAIGHEMAHVARHDFALKILYEVLLLPVSFHPACWLIVRGVEETREMACDELVTQKLLDAKIYARSIMNIAAVMSPLVQPGYTLGVFDRDILEQRIKRLVSRQSISLKRARLLLVGGLAAVALCTVIASGVALTARAQTSDVDSKLKSLEPLMNELMRNPADARLMAQTRQTLLDVLALDPANQQALNAMMSLEIAARQPAEARQWALKMVSAYPKEKTSYYCVGFTDWSVVYPAVMAARTAAGMRPEDANFIADAGTRRTLREQYGALLDEAVKMLGIALWMDPQYSDAMAYMNLLYRLKANVADSEQQSAVDIATADEWVGKALAAKRVQPPAARGSNIRLAAPPPPPPPPPPPQFPDDTPASDAFMPAPLNPAERPGSYWQVMGATDTPAKALMTQLNAQNFPARFVISGSDRLVRVMVGPFLDDNGLAAARSRLEAAGFRVIRAW